MDSADEAGVDVVEPRIFEAVVYLVVCQFVV